MSVKCDCEASDAMLLTCSGGSNVGRYTNRIAVELTQEGLGRMFCLAGIGAGIDGMVRSAMDVEKLIVIDGCDIACAKKVLEAQNIREPEYYFVLTEMGVEKNKDFNLRHEELALLKEDVAKRAGLAPGEGG